MNLLLDSHLLIWALSEPTRLSKTARTLINDSGNRLYFSAASLWELSIKAALGPRSLPLDIRSFHKTLLENDYNELAVLSGHAMEVATLPRLHGDPFDRLLIAQARVEGMTLLTVDRELGKYPASVRVV